jgi:hypothetical protein
MEKLERIKRLDEKVRWTMKMYPSTRNDDTALTLKIIECYLPDHIRFEDWGGTWVTAEAMFRVREDCVKRIRAKIQNIEGKFLPDDPVVRAQRKLSQQAWETYLAKYSQLPI